MPWYGWLLVGYFCLDRLCTIGLVGHSIKITPGIAVGSLATGGLIVWAILALGGVA